MLGLACAITNSGRGHRIGSTLLQGRSGEHLRAAELLSFGCYGSVLFGDDRSVPSRIRESCRKFSSRVPTNLIKIDVWGYVSNSQVICSVSEDSHTWGISSVPCWPVLILKPAPTIRTE